MRAPPPAAPPELAARQLCDWLDAQHPRAVGKLQARSVGETPTGGWEMVVTA